MDIKNHKTRFCLKTYGIGLSSVFFPMAAGAVGKNSLHTTIKKINSLKELSQQYAILSLVNLKKKCSKIYSISKEIFTIYIVVQIKIRISFLSPDGCKWTLIAQTLSGSTFSGKDLKVFLNSVVKFTKRAFITTHFYYRK